MLIFIIIIILIVSLIYYKYFFFTIYDDDANNIIMTIQNIESEIQNNVNSTDCDNLLYKYVNLDKLFIDETKNNTNDKKINLTNNNTISTANIVDKYIQSYSNCENFDNLNHQNKIVPINSIENFIINIENKSNRIIWIYWENVNRNNYPTYIKLCLDTMNKHLKNKYNLILLNEKIIKNYLPDLRNDFDNLKIAQKVDYYRISLLQKYGGIWLDSDIIVMRDFDPIFQKLDEGYDYVGFGCTGYKCSYGYFRPSNWFMGTKKNSILMTKCLEKLNKKLDLRNINQTQNDSTYHDYGKTVLWDSLDELKSSGYNYYHFNSEFDGTRDINKKWIHVDNFFSTNKTNFLNESKLFFVVLYNSEFASNHEYKWVYNCDESRLLYGNEWICSLYRKSLFS